MDRTADLKRPGLQGIRELARPLHYLDGVPGVHLPKRRLAATRR